MPNTNKEDFLSKRDFYEQYWKCRDFELKTLWQRSIFLGSFLILCFTGYGAFFEKAFISENTCLVLGSCCNLSEKIFEHVIADVLALIGMVFSMLWIAMAKGSKAWYERYEKAIESIEKEMQSFSSTYEQGACAFGYNNRLFYHNPDLDENILSGKGGPFSPSKINIALGQVSLVIWIAVFCFHIFFILGQIFNGQLCSKLFAETSIFSILFCLVLLTFLTVFFAAGLPKVIGIFDIKSETLKSSDESNEYSKHANDLQCLEKIRRIISSEIGTLQTEIVKESTVYLVIPIMGKSGYKLDVSLKNGIISACFKRLDNKSFSDEDVALLKKWISEIETNENGIYVGNSNERDMEKRIAEIVGLLKKMQHNVF